MKIEACCICTGGKPEINIGHCKIIKKDNYQIKCLNCGCSGPVSFDKEGAISQWNDIQEAYFYAIDNSII